MRKTLPEWDLCVQGPSESLIPTTSNVMRSEAFMFPMIISADNIHRKWYPSFTAAIVVQFGCFQHYFTADAVIFRVPTDLTCAVSDVSFHRLYHIIKLKLVSLCLQ
jgi:hypothetical protein